MLKESKTIDGSKLDTFFSTNKGSIRFALVYGQDEGAATLAARKIVSSLLQNEDKEYGVTKHIYSEIASNPLILKEFLQSSSLFADKRVLIVEGCGENLNADILKILKSIGTDRFDNSVLFVADDVKKSSKIVKSLESLPHTLVVPCYKLDINSAAQFIGGWLKMRKVSFDNEVPTLLANLLLLDKLLIENELSKLLLYVEDSHLKRQDIEAMFDYSEQDGSIDMLCHAFYAKNKQAVLENLDKLLRFENHYMLICRALQNYATRLYTVRTMMLEGADTDTAIAKLSPPIFFKVKEVFKANIQKNNIKKIKSMLEKLILCESTMKNLHLVSQSVLLKHMLLDLVDG